MFTIEIKVHTQVNSEPPTYRWVCPLCGHKIPNGENRIFETTSIDVKARIHMMLSHRVNEEMLETVVAQ